MSATSDIPVGLQLMYGTTPLPRLLEVPHWWPLCKFLDGVDQPLAHVEFAHGGPKSVMPYSIEGFLKINEDMIYVLLMLAIFLAQNLRLNICSVVFLFGRKLA